MELQAVTGQLHIIDGELQEATAVPGLLAQSAPTKAARGREHDFLFVHLTLPGSPEETAVLVQDLLDAISRRFYRETGSVTAALRRAVIEANELLLHFNLSGTAPIREGAITAAALHHSELFMLQTGEALALLGHNFGVERLPSSVPDRITPLGRSAGIDLRFFHYRLQSGNLLLLADPRIAHLPTQLLSPALVDTEVEFGLVELEEAIGHESARLLLIEFTEDAPADMPELARTPSSGEALAAVGASFTGRRSPSSSVAVSGARQGTRSTTVASPGPARTLSVESGRRPVSLEFKARQATSDTALGLSRFTAWLARLLARVRPSRRRRVEKTGVAIPAIVAVVIPVIVAAVISGVYLQRGRVRQFAQLKVEISQHLAQAESAGTDGELARSHHRAVLALAVEAEQLRAGDDEISRLRDQALSALDQLDDVTRLPARILYEYEEGVNLAAVVLREGLNGGIYTLDAASGAVYQHVTDDTYLNLVDGEPESVVFGGQAVGSHVVGTVIDMMWRPRGNSVSRDGLAVLDSNGVLLSYYPNFADSRAVPLGLASDWRFPRAITSFDERLYVLDIGAGQIWKYFPDGDGFILKDTDRTISFNEDPGLSGVVDIAIYSEDGSLILLYGDGRLRYYDTRSGRTQWDEAGLLRNGLGSPLLAPVAVQLVGRGLNASIFVADPGSGRIIQLSRGGTVLAQYRASDSSGRELFAQISAFAVAETPLRIFATTGNTLYVAAQE
jgi:hypothetical protein